MRRKAQVSPKAGDLIGRYTRVVKHRRRVGGGFGTVQDLFWRGDEPWLVLQLPTGQRVAAALTWTDLARDCRPTKNTTPQLSPTALLEMARYCRSLKERGPQARARSADQGMG